MKHYSDNFKATIFLGIASFVTSGINYITTPIFTRLLTTSEYGLISKYNSVYLIVSVIATLTLSRPGILSVGLYEHKDNRWSFLSCMLGEVAVATCIVTVLISVFWNAFQEIIGLPYSLVLLMLCTCFLQSATTFWTYKQRYEYNYKSTFIVLVGSALCAQVFSVMAVIWCKNHCFINLGIVRLFSAGVINLLVAIVIYVIICIKGKKFVDIYLWKRTLVFAIPLIPHYFGFALLNGTDKIMIGKLIGDDKLGVYSLASVISLIGALIWQALCVSITPYVYDKLGKRDFLCIGNAVKPVLELAALACILINLLSPEIIMVMGTSDYIEGIYIIPIVAAGTYMHIIYDLFSNVAFFKKKSTSIMFATIIAAIINVILNYIFIPIYGYMAASYTTFISYLLLAILHYVISRMVEKEIIFDIKYCIKISLLVIFSCFLILPLFQFDYLRYIIGIVLIGFLFLRKNYYIIGISNMKV